MQREGWDFWGCYTGAMDLIDDRNRWAGYEATVQALERIRARELAAMTDEEALRKIMSLAVSETPWRERPEWSGLVEQQAIFQRRKK